MLIDDFDVILGFDLLFQANASIFLHCNKILNGGNQPCFVSSMACMRASPQMISTLQLIRRDIYLP
ncbi:unnamed protein product [Spirodela intermedia]|uniref:Uncharacterized protein n=1 Tax=Spirodela intermedia TaxID=51605 RepID=A0A7I8LK86_SPIIN|nr:unnamed protein product [Spirodela intermedia]